MSRALPKSDTGNDFHVGNWETGKIDSPFEGIIDELRISTVVRSAAWLAAQYLSMGDSFITFGLPEPSDMVEYREVWRRPG